MFGSLNDEIKKIEATESPRIRLLRYASIVAVSVFCFWALYAGILYLE